MVASFYPSHVIGRSPHGATAWWEGQALRQGDWVGLVSRLYSGIFAPDFLTPMQAGHILMALTILELKCELYFEVLIL